MNCGGFSNPHRVQRRGSAEPHILQKTDLSGLEELHFIQRMLSISGPFEPTRAILDHGVSDYEAPRLSWHNCLINFETQRGSLAKAKGNRAAACSTKGPLHQNSGNISNFVQRGRDAPKFA
jgi:hypothetical protein